VFCSLSDTPASFGSIPASRQHSLFWRFEPGFTTGPISSPPFFREKLLRWRENPFSLRPRAGLRPPPGASLSSGSFLGTNPPLETGLRRRLCRYRESMPRFQLLPERGNPHRVLQANSIPCRDREDTGRTVPSRCPVCPPTLIHGPQGKGALMMNSSKRVVILLIFEARDGTFDNLVRAFRNSSRQLFSLFPGGSRGDFYGPRPPQSLSRVEASGRDSKRREKSPMIVHLPQRPSNSRKVKAALGVLFTKKTFLDHRPSPY